MENPFEGPSEPITLEMITKAINKMASGKAAGPSGIVAESKKPLGEAGVAEVLDFIDTTQLVREVRKCQVQCKKL